MVWIKVPVAVNEIDKFEKNNDIAVNVLGIKGQKTYTCRKSDRKKEVVNLLLIDNREKRHYSMITKLSRLLGYSNSIYRHKQHFCRNCFQGFHSEKSRDNHFENSKDNKAVRIEMPKEGSFVEFHNGQNQFNSKSIHDEWQFIMYADFGSDSITSFGLRIAPEVSYTKEISQRIASGFSVYHKFLWKG